MQKHLLQKRIVGGGEKQKEKNLMSKDYETVESVLLKKVNIVINNLGLCNPPFQERVLIY